MTYNRINGEDIEFVDEEGNVIVASEESIIYVNRKGKEIDEKRAKRALNSGQYIDERSLYDDRYAPNSQRKDQQQRQQPDQQHRPQQQHQPMQSYNNKLSTHSTSDLIANMQKIFAEAHKNAKNQPDIGMIENDARSRSNTPPRHYQQNSYEAELNLQEQLKQLKEAKKLQERQQRHERHERERKQKEEQRQLEKKRQKEYERQMELQRQEQQKAYERQLEQQKQYQKQLERQQRDYYKQMERQQKEYEKQQMFEADKAKKLVTQKPPIGYQPSLSKNQLNSKHREHSSATKSKSKRSSSTKRIQNSHSHLNPYAQLQSNYLSGPAATSSFTNNVSSSSNRLNSREVDDSIRNLQKLLSKTSMADSKKTGRDRSLQPSKHSSNNNTYLSNSSHGNLAHAASGANLVPYGQVPMADQQQQMLQQQMIYQQQQQMMYSQFGDYSGSGYADDYSGAGYNYDYGY